MKPGETRNETRRDPERNRARPAHQSHQFHQFRQTGLSGQFFRRGGAEAPSIPSIPSNGPFWTVLSKGGGRGPINSINSVNSALSGEGVPTPHSVLATGLVSRDAQEFGISQACRLSGFEMPGCTIFGAPKSLQTGRALASEPLGSLVRG